MIDLRRHLQAQRPVSDTISRGPQKIERFLGRAEEARIVTVQVQMGGPMRMLQSPRVRHARRPFRGKGNEDLAIAVAPPMSAKERAQLIEARRIDQHVDITGAAGRSETLKRECLALDAEDADAVPRGESLDHRREQRHRGALRNFHERIRGSPSSRRARSSRSPCHHASLRNPESSVHTGVVGVKRCRFCPFSPALAG